MGKNKLQNCWELMQCGREAGGARAQELGTCPAYPRFGHSCWIVAGTFCSGTVQGTYATKRASCLTCAVYKEYNLSHGTKRYRFRDEHETEHAQLVHILRGARTAPR